MGAWIGVSVLACTFLVGCGSGLQVGLANGPVLGGDTPETRVHDVIANGHDACERGSFPPGEVLRGQIPPCSIKERLSAIPAFMPKPLPAGTWIAPTYPFRACRGWTNRGPGLIRSEETMAAYSSSTSSRLVCGEAL
jgi:hypothetical protein